MPEHIGEQTDTTSEATFESFKEDLGKLRADFERLLRTGMTSAGAQLGEYASRTRESIQQATQSTGMDWSTAAETAAARARSGIEEVRRHVEQRPLAAAGIAAGVGVLIGALWINRR